MITPLLKNKAVMISALDQIVSDKKINPELLLYNHNYNVIVPTIKSQNHLLSYVLRDDCGEAIQIFEKKRISPEAVLGIYIFKNYMDFLNSSSELLIQYRGFQNKTFYTSDIINNFLMKNIKIHFPMLDLEYKKINYQQGNK